MSHDGGRTARIIDRALGWLPRPPDERRPWSPLLPDPHEVGISDAVQRQRIALITTLREKQGKGGSR